AATRVLTRIVRTRIYPLPTATRGDGKTQRNAPMPTWRRKPPNDHDFNKRSSSEQRTALADAAQAATARLYAEVLFFWGRCQHKKCRRHRRCLGEPLGCFNRNKPEVPDIFHGGARYQGIPGGPRPIPPPNPAQWPSGRSRASLWFR